MRNYIIVFNDYFMDGLIKVVEETTLQSKILGVTTYGDCIDCIRNTPNVLGVVVILYNTTTKTKQFLRTVVDSLEVIATSRNSTAVLSLLYRNKNILKAFKDIKSTNVTITQCKYYHMNEEIIRLDGLVPVIMHTQGVFKYNPQSQFVLDKHSIDIIKRNSLIEALVYISGKETDSGRVNEYIKKHPELKKIYSLMTSDIYEEELIKKYKDSIYELFCQIFIERRRHEVH